MKLKDRKLKHNLQITLKKLEKEDIKLLKQFEKLDNRTNTFLSISLGVFSLQITILTNTIISMYEKYIQKQNILVIIILIFFILNILFNINGITNFRKSTKISEKIYSNVEDINESTNCIIEENLLLKEEILTYYNVIQENKSNILYKKKYINRGLNNIVVSIILIITLIVFLFLLIWNNGVIL